MASETQNGNWLKRHRKMMLILGPAVVAVVAAFFYITGGRYVSTDDAYIQSARTDITANISGSVTEILVHDNQQVKKGDLLFRLDERPLRIALEEAQAQLASARLQIASLKALYHQKQADRQSADSTLSYQLTELNRQKKLAASGISSKAQLDQAQHAYDSAMAQETAAKDQIASALANLGGNADIDVDQHPTVQRAQAMVDKAKLNLSYATVTAPSDGIVAKVEQLQVGDYITAATPVFSLMSNAVWVEANFKETDLTYMRPGQKATISIDTYPGKTFNGTVTSTSPGTGSSFSLLPPENATGNWVKVVQRLPVRIAIDRGDDTTPLSAGMSAVVEVDTQHHRHFFGTEH
jgi:membrane fusion protein (multidrug efflux system)